MSRSSLLAACLLAGAALNVKSTPFPGTVNTWGDVAAPGGVSNVVAISTGVNGSFDLALKSDGTVLAWGDDLYGQTDLPPGLTNVIAVAAGDYHGLALKSDGTVVAWGDDYYGERDVPPGLSNVVAIAAGESQSLALKSDGTVVGWGGPAATPPCGLVRVAAVAAGFNHCLALLQNGKVVGWGDNTYGEADSPPGLSNVVAVAAGNGFNLALKSDGTIVGWGLNGVSSYGQQTPPAGLSNVVAIAAGNRHSLALLRDGTVFGWGYDLSGQASPPSGLTNAVAVCAGANHSVALLSNGGAEITAMPANQSVLPGATVTFNAVAAGSPTPHYQWEFDGTNVLGATNNSLVLPNAQTGDAGGYSLVASNFASNVICVVTSRVARLTVLGPGNVVGWGDNCALQTDPPFVISNIAFLCRNASLAVRTDGTVFGWGGEENLIPGGLSDVIALAAGGARLALKRDGTVVAWGDNSNGEAAVPFGLANVVAIAAGDNHSLALCADGTVVGWGLGANADPNVAPWDSLMPPPDLVGVTAIVAAGAHSLALRFDGTVVQWPGSAPTNLTNIVAIAAGPNHNLALRADGTVAAWGDGVGTNVPAGLSNVVAIAAGYQHSLALKADGSVVAWGNNAWGESVVPPLLAKVSDISASSFSPAFSLALLSDGRPIITAQPANQVTATGGVASFRVLVASSVPVSYQWQFNGTNIIGATNSTFSVNSVSPAKLGKYGMVITSSYGSIVSESATLANPLPPYFHTEPSSRQVNPGANVIFKSLAVSTVPVSYQWRHDGTNISGANSPDLIRYLVQTADAGSYTVVASNAAGSVTSAPAALTITGPGRVVAWGDDSYGQSEPPGGLTDAIDVSAGAEHSMALRANGTVVCWGSNSNNQTAVPAGLSNVVAISAGAYHSMALKNDGTVVCWGANGFGQSSPPSNLTNVVAITGGLFQSLALKRDGTVVGWGLGATNPPSSLTGAITIAASGSEPAGQGDVIRLYGLALQSNGVLVSWGTADALTLNAPDTRVDTVAIASGEGHALAIISGGRVLGWGGDTFGQADVPPGLSNVLAVAAGGEHSLALLPDETVMAWGLDNYGQTNVPADLTQALAIAAGRSHSLALVGPGQPTVLASNAWTALGPGRIVGERSEASALFPNGYPLSATSGRVVGIAPDPTYPDRIYLAASGGGVWKTSDGGLHWIPLTDTQITTAMGAIAIAPSDPNVIYAGTGEQTGNYIPGQNWGFFLFGRGILKSTDGGTNWTLEGQSLFDRRTTTRIVVDPTNPSVVYAAIAPGEVNGLNGNAGLWKSTDGGVDWINTTAAISTTDTVSDVVMDPSNPQILYAAVSAPMGAPANGVYKTINGGASWSRAGNFPSGSNLGNIKLALAASSPQVIYASIAAPTVLTNHYTFNSVPICPGLYKMMKTTDGGSTWTELTNVPNYLIGQGQFTSALAVDPSNPDIVYAGGTALGWGQLSGLIQSVDGGDTWYAIDQGADGFGVHGDCQTMAFDADGRLLLGDDGGIWRLDDAVNVLWTNLNSDLNTVQFNGIALDPGNPTVIYGGTQDNGTVKFFDASQWTELLDGDGGYVHVDPVQPATVYTERYGPGVYRSDDNGITWARVINGLLADNSFFYMPYEMDASHPNRLVMGTDKVYETVDRGDDWTLLSAPGLFGWNTNAVIRAMALAPTDTNTFYASAGGLIYATFDHANSWHERDIGGMAAGWIQALLVDPDNNLTVYAARASYDGGHVFYTTDGGMNWTDISGNLPALPAYSLALDPRTAPHTLYVGNHNGVYVTQDLGGHWSRVGAGLPNVIVAGIEVNTNLNILAAGTYGRGLWEIPLNAVISSPPPRLIAVSSGNTTLTLSWPGSASGFVLEASGSLAPLADWMPVANSPALTNGQYQVTLPTTNAAQFFRLKGSVIGQ